MTQVTMNDRAQIRMKNLTKQVAISMMLLVGAFALLANCNNWRQPTTSAFAARRAADDARPLIRLASGHRRAASSWFETAESQPGQETVVVGKFKAPSPDRMQQQRVPKAQNFVSQSMSASFRVSDDETSATKPEKVVHGITGSSSGAANKQRVVGAKIQVSDEGLNYPPSKLSADIYGNVAEIVTAPPEAVESNLFLPSSRRFSATSNQNRP